MKQALIVVDVQESFRRRPYFGEQDLPAFLRNVQSRGVFQQKIPVLNGIVSNRKFGT